MRSKKRNSTRRGGLKRANALLLVIILMTSMNFSVADTASRNVVYPAPSAERQTTGEYSASVAYAPSIDEYLVVYQDYNDLAIASSIRGQFVDSKGDKHGVSFTIAQLSRDMPENPYVVYNSTDDNFLVVWNDGISTARRIYGLVVDIHGDKGGKTPVVFDTVPGMNESHDTPKAAYNPVNNSYSIVWNIRNDFEVLLEGAIVGPELIDPTMMEFGVLDHGADDFDIIYNPVSETTVIAIEYGDSSSAVLRTLEVNAEDGTVTMSEPVIPGLKNLKTPRMTHNSVKEDDYMLWRYDADSKHHILGRYRLSTGNMIDFSSNLIDESNPLSAGVNDETGAVLVAWSESIGDKGVLYTQELDKYGKAVFDDPVALVSVTGYMTDLNVNYSPSEEKFVVTYIMHKKLTNPELKVSMYPIDEALNMEGVAEKDSAKNVDDITHSLADQLTDTTEKLVKDDVKKVFDVLETNIENITTEEILVPALEKYIETVDALGDAAEDPANEKFVEEKLVDIAGVITDSIQNIESSEDITMLAESFLGQVNTVHDAGLEQTVELNVTVGDLAQSVIDKIGEVEPEFETVVVDEKTQILFDAVSLENQIKDTVLAFDTVSDAFEEYYGENNVREFELQVSLETERVGNDMQVPISKELVDKLESANVDSVGVKVGGTQLLVDQSVFKDAVDEDTNLLVDMSFDDQSYTSKQEELTFKKGYTTDVQLLVDGVEQKVLDEPVQLAFDLDSFEFFDEQFNPSLVSVFRLNEETGEWEPVGGVYDPVKNTVSTKRISLSQYTVMQSNKSFNDVENSWAKSEINELLGKGILDDVDTFNPEDAVTREEFTTWVTRAYGLTNEEATAPFTDISTESTHLAEIASAYDKGIISGSSETTFNPDGNITKEQMTVILANAMVSYDKKKLNEELTTGLDVYSDRDLVANWASDEMALMIELGIIKVGERGIGPQDTVTKEMAASIIKKING